MQCAQVRAALWVCAALAALAAINTPRPRGAVLHYLHPMSMHMLGRARRVMHDVNGARALHATQPLLPPASAPRCPCGNRCAHAQCGQAYTLASQSAVRACATTEFLRRHSVPLLLRRTKVLAHGLNSAPHVWQLLTWQALTGGAG